MDNHMPSVLNAFSLSDRWWEGLWGGGHTVDTDPTRRGWRAALSHKDSKVLILGRRGVVGCASVMRMAGGRLDISGYDDATPEEISACVRERRPVPLADVTFQTEASPGWGLAVLEKILL